MGAVLKAINIMEHRVRKICSSVQAFLLQKALKKKSKKIKNQEIHSQLNLNHSFLPSIR